MSTLKRSLDQRMACCAAFVRIAARASACFRLDVCVGSSAPELLRRTIGMRCAPGIYTMSAASDVISTSDSEVRT